ncbi:sodium/proton antiporter (NhaA family) [Acinetobacter calcoaceticus]|uniref:Na(+)/H(+) antiporter NhaA n=1 Tax=Acinetobacter calcoaceticus TaxID=471 RepID=A0A4R1XRG0_ACICA|nr:sodium/proton antiporter (NhaA family) [Acinetobacter calcoaceticus]
MSDGSQSKPTIPALQRLTEQAQHYAQVIRSIEAMSGIVLLVFTAIALIWANSMYAQSYLDFLHSPIGFNLGTMEVNTTVHFVINDVLMTIFFLVVGAEVRHEIHDGALADIKMASLPIIAACGGVIVPALIYLAFNRGEHGILQGWAIPTATDIAFAVGILALLGKSVPTSARIFLLTLAIIDDIIAVLIIALFYTESLNFAALSFVAIGLVLVMLFQRMGIFAMPPYIVPGLLIWYGLFKVGVHPSLAGVILGLLTPVISRPSTFSPAQQAERALQHIQQQPDNPTAIEQLRIANRELRSPVHRVSYQLAPWVAFLIMPLFALANAGVNISQVSLDYVGANEVVLGIAVALVLGKPLGIFLITWISVRLGIGKLSDQFSYSWLLLVSCLAGIGFTMSIFIATLAFSQDQILMDAAKLGVLIGSFIAAVIGIVLGIYLKRKN